MAVDSSRLEIDAEKTIALFEDYLQDLVKKEKANGILFGLSGGIDSMLLGALCVRAIGEDKVHVMYIHDRDSDPIFKARCIEAAKWLGLELGFYDMEPELREQGIYKPFVMKITKSEAGIHVCQIDRYSGRYL